MDLKNQVLHILERSRELELEIIASLPDADRVYEGTFDKWSAKDTVAHANYWQDVRTARTVAWIEGTELESLPQFEQANADCYKQFKKQTWAEVEAFAQQTHEKMVETVQGLNVETLAGPAEESDNRKLWQSLIDVAYSHKLMHYADFYHERGQQDVAGYRAPKKLQSFDNFQIRHIDCRYSLAFGVCFV